MLLGFGRWSGFVPGPFHALVAGRFGWVCLTWAWVCGYGMWGVGWVTWVVGWPAGWLVCVWAFQCQTLEQIVSHARTHVSYTCIGCTYMITCGWIHMLYNIMILHSICTRTPEELQAASLQQILLQPRSLWGAALSTQACLQREICSHICCLQGCSPFFF